MDIEVPIVKNHRVNVYNVINNLRSICNDGTEGYFLLNVQNYIQILQEEADKDHKYNRSTNNIEMRNYVDGLHDATKEIKKKFANREME